MPRKVGSKNSKPKAPNRDRTPTQKEADLARIQELDLLGWSQTRIAKAINRSQGLVSTGLKTIRERYHDAYVDDRKALTMRELAVVAKVREEAFEQLERLKQGKRKKRNESGNNDKGGWDKEVTEEEDVEYSSVLNVLLDTVRETAALMGLKELPAVTFNIDNRQQTVSLASPEALLQLFLSGRAAEKADPVQQRIDDVERKAEQQGEST